ncbi:MAG: gas vesicle protein [Thermoleophilia bacterium]
MSSRLIWMSPAITMPLSSTRSRMSARDLALEARATIKDMTGLEPERVSGLQWDGESWLVTVEVLEVRRIPETTDVLSRYEIDTDEGGELTGYRRIGRYTRGSARED